MRQKAIRISIALCATAAALLAVSAASAASPTFTPARPAGPAAPSTIVRSTAPAHVHGLPHHPSRDQLVSEIRRLREALEIGRGSGGGQLGPFGRTCAEARANLRWDALPCSPDMPAK